MLIFNVRNGHFGPLSKQAFSTMGNFGTTWGNFAQNNHKKYRGVEVSPSTLGRVQFFGILSPTRPYVLYRALMYVLYLRFMTRQSQRGAKVKKRKKAWAEGGLGVRISMTFFKLPYCTPLGVFHKYFCNHACRLRLQSFRSPNGNFKQLLASGSRYG